MKTRYASLIRMSLGAGALALLATGCGTMHRSADRSVEPAGYVGGTPGIPPSIDAFSTRYVPFPPSGSETGSMAGHSGYCVVHVSQPGCQTPDSVSDPRGLKSVNRY